MQQEWGLYRDTYKRKTACMTEQERTTTNDHVSNLRHQGAENEEKTSENIFIKQKEDDE